MSNNTVKPIQLVIGNSRVRVYNDKLAILCGTDSDLGLVSALLRSVIEEPRSRFFGLHVAVDLGRPLKDVVYLKFPYLYTKETRREYISGVLDVGSLDEVLDELDVALEVRRWFRDLGLPYDVYRTYVKLGDSWISIDEAPVAVQYLVMAVSALYLGKIVMMVEPETMQSYTTRFVDVLTERVGSDREYADKTIIVATRSPEIVDRLSVAGFTTITVANNNVELRDATRPRQAVAL